MKLVIFNVGGALSSYLEYDGKKLVIDLGKTGDFSPTLDFLKPLFEKNKHTKNSKGKFLINQLIISHPHNDHISDIRNFNANFYPTLLTTPNDNPGMPEDEKINWNLVMNPSDKYTNYLRKEVLPGRKPPLASSDPNTLSIHYIKPKYCEHSEELKNCNYSNNISLCIYIRYLGHTVLFPGDLMKDGMSYLINNDTNFKQKLGLSGVDFLITPHHGLKSSFSTSLYSAINGGKTRRLHVVSEKVSYIDSGRVVDDRYSSENYCLGNNTLSKPLDKVYQRKTSRGHIFIDFTYRNPQIEILDTEQLLSAF